ncbi:MAG: nuclear transport factor 2 family protein, partial [Candidatus Hydrogenedentota bacterium]
MNNVDVVREWLDCFNAADVDRLTALYAEDAVNHQVVMEPLEGRVAIRAMFEVEFGRAKMVCVPEKIHEAGDWVVLE